jgi:CRP-like cAMP-binding protein
VTLDVDVAWLARTRPFSLMPREAVQLIAFSCRKRRVRAGDALFHPGEAGDEGYFVNSGAFLLTETGRPDSARRIEAGALIGESALYAPITRSFEARAIEDSIVTRVPRETFRRVLSEFPSAAHKIRAALAERTRRLVNGLDAARVRSIDPHAPKPRATP